MSKKRFENDQAAIVVTVGGDTKAVVTPGAAAGASMLIENLAVLVPVGQIGPEDYCSSHYELNILRHQGLRRTMRRLYNGLVAADARTADGRRVTKGADVLRWVIEQIAKAAGEELPR